MPSASNGATVLFNVEIPGEPVPWARAQGGAGPAKFTAPRQKAYARTIGQYFIAAGARPAKAWTGVPLSLTVQVLLPVPASWRPEKRAAALAGHIRPISRPDLDNWLKLPMDALNGLVWKDDAQVVDLGESGKWYAEKPCLRIVVRLV